MLVGTRLINRYLKKLEYLFNLWNITARKLLYKKLKTVKKTHTKKIPTVYLLMNFN